MNEFTAGAGYLGHGFRLICQPKLRLYAAMPVAITVLCYAAAIWWMVSSFGAIIDGWRESWPDWLSWAEWLIWVVAAALVLVVLWFTFAIVASFLSCPFNGLLAEATEYHLTGRKLPPEAFARLLKRTPHMLWQETKKLVYFVLWSVPFLLLFLVPVVNVAAGFTWFAFGAWISALEFCDYPMDNNGLLFHQVRARMAQKKARCFGFGAATYFLLTIPLVGIVTLPAAVAGATKLWVDDLEALEN